MKINFIQDEATPHNNILIDAINKRYPGTLKLWYSKNKSAIYDWSDDLNNSILKSETFGEKKVSLKLLSRVLSRESIFLVGWVNPTARLMILVLFFLRKPYSMWFDLPNENNKRSLVSKLFRELFYFFIKNSQCRVFCVGSKTVEYFEKRKFKKQMLVNLPVFVVLDKNYKCKGEIRSKYNVKASDLFITAGSRLVREKGFDILIEALSKSKYKSRIKLVIVGKGKEKSYLENRIFDLQLKKQVFLEDWLDIDPLRYLIATSDLFIHPARWDAFGAGTLNAMALKTAVIASNQSGSGPDRIINGVNGWLYDAEDVQELSSLIDNAFENRYILDEIANTAFLTSKQWPVERGVKIFRDNIV